VWRIASKASRMRDVWLSWTPIFVFIMSQLITVIEFLLVDAMADKPPHEYLGFDRTSLIFSHHFLVYSPIFFHSNSEPRFSSADSFRVFFDLRAARASGVTRKNSSRRHNESSSPANKAWKAGEMRNSGIEYRIARAWAKCEPRKLQFVRALLLTARLTPSPRARYNSSCYYTSFSSIFKKKKKKNDISRAVRSTRILLRYALRSKLPDIDANETLLPRNHIAPLVSRVHWRILSKKIRCRKIRDK